DHELGSLDDGPRLCVGLRIIDRDRDLHVTEIFPSISFRDVERVRAWMALLIDPGLSVKPARFHDQCVAIVMPNRVAQPCRIRIDGQFTAIEENLPELRECLIQDHNLIRKLNELPRYWRRIDLRYALWQTVRIRLFSRASARRTIVVHGLGPGLHRHV